jgi:hypothetical protein
MTIVTMMVRVAIGLCLGVALSACALAQPATPAQREGVPDRADFATMHLRTQLGSFKIVPAGDTPAMGRFEMTFTGTVLIHDLKGRLETAGKLRLEYNDHGRRVFTGTGRIVVTGEWRSMQWFGSNMEAVWYGRGLIRVSGEFDRNLNTGEYWYDDPKQKYYWYPGASMQVELPQAGAPPAPPVERRHPRPVPKTSGKG